MVLWKRLAVLTPLVSRTFRHEVAKHSFHHVTKNSVNSTSVLSNLKPAQFSHDTIRWKSKKQQLDDSDDEEDFQGDDKSLSKDSKVAKFSTTSMRTDVILKSALGVARNKIETYFYESKIRVNGKKILKKSASVRVGDEIDVIKMVSPKNPDHIYVARVEILNVTAAEDSISVTARRFKNLLIENYEEDPHKGSADGDSANQNK